MSSQVCSFWMNDVSLIEWLSPSSSVTSAKGARIQKQFFGELVDRLISIAPEVAPYLK